MSVEESRAFTVRLNVTAENKRFISDFTFILRQKNRLEKNEKSTTEVLQIGIKQYNVYCEMK